MTHGWLPDLVGVGMIHGCFDQDGPLVDHGAGEAEDGPITAASTTDYGLDLTSATSIRAMLLEEVELYVDQANIITE